MIDNESQNSEISLHGLLKLMLEKGASDLHITAASAPVVRVDGEMEPLELPALRPADCKRLCYSVLTDQQKHLFEETKELDFAFGVKGLARFRANLFVQRGVVSGAFRQIPLQILSPEELGLPKVVVDMCKKPRGLILCTGPTGSGKSTTLSTLIDKINQENKKHIITIEDPIEFLHPHKGCIVSQREVKSDTENFTIALKHVLRQDPDVVLVGEMRDLETIQAGLTIAETGHLCFATLHTNSTVQTIHRMIDVFPARQQAQVRAQLSFVLEGIVTQTLLPKASGIGRVLACEVLVPNAAIRNLIREDKLHQVYTQMQIGQGQHGMITMNQSLQALYAKRVITYETAKAASSDPEELEGLLNKSRNPNDPRSGQLNRTSQVSKLSSSKNLSGLGGNK